MASAPRDATPVLLLMSGGDHRIEDTSDGLWRTIGHNNDDNVYEHEREGWQVAGWCWSHDHYTESRGAEPIAWAPMPEFPLHVDFRAGDAA
ncbi:MAG: hypothetical protein MI755_16500 [Sphingomonadales bacterium]|nr:hypothetical protein [Sphingomonadales bacterium]